MKRNSAYDLMKIISMFLIVLCHMITHGQVLSHINNPTLEIMIQFLFLGTLVHVNSFVLVTGYFQCENSFKSSKVWSLINASMFYKIVFLLIFGLGFHYSLSALQVFKELLPFNLDEYWFIRTYIFLYCLSPFINLLIKKLKQKQYQNLLLVMFLIFSVLPYITGNQAFSNDGYTLYHFIFLYLIGAYLRKYPIQKSFLFERCSTKMFQLICIIFLFVGWISNFITYTAFASFSGTHSIIEWFSNNIMTMTYAYSNPLLLLQSISYFLLFSTFTFTSKWITSISACTMGVYLIHDHPLVNSWLYTALGIRQESITSYQILLQIVVSAILVFVVCLVIEFLRRQLFKFIYHRKISKRIRQRYHNWIYQLTHV